MATLRCSFLPYLIRKREVAIERISAIDRFDLFPKERFVFGISFHISESTEQFHAVLALVFTLTSRVTVLQDIWRAVLHLPHCVAITRPKGGGVFSF